jgi:hypothetical protein
MLQRVFYPGSLAEGGIITSAQKKRMHIVNEINAFFCGVVWVAGLIIYRKSKIKASFYIGIAFGFLGFRISWPPECSREFRMSF